jgi:electron transport complex protein RnfE
MSITSPVTHTLHDTLPEYRRIFMDGLWHNNHALVALLGLCPLLAVSNNVVNALGLGIATMFVLVISNASISLIRHWVSRDIRIPVYVTVIAALVTAVDVMMEVFTPNLHAVLGIFIPLIVTNCIILARAEGFASKNSVDKALIDGLAIGLGFTLALIVLGGMRELLGNGTLFAQANMLFGSMADNWTLHVFTLDHGVLLAILPPGAFIGLGLLIAATNAIKAKQQARQIQQITVAMPVTPTQAQPDAK